MSRAVLFDLDGTLADTAHDLLGALNKLCAEMHKAPTSLSTIRPYVTQGSTKLVELALDIPVDDTNHDAACARFVEHYAFEVANKTTLMPGMDELLESLDQRAIPWAIVTNKASFLTHPLVTALGLATRAACVVAGDTTQHPKPHPSPLLFACEAIGCGPQGCVYVGDARTDVIAAQRAGMRAVVASYGYIPPDQSPDEWRADAIVDSVSALDQWLSENGFY